MSALHHFRILRALAVQFSIFKNPSIPQQIRSFVASRHFGHSNYPKYLRGDSDFPGIFSGGPPSHSGFLQKYGINLHSTFPGEIQISERCDTREG